jgi:hypothetical protein
MVFFIFALTCLYRILNNFYEYIVLISFHHAL